ncbi:phytanoyl-CoA dioxygenase family protein [Pseudomonadales bacterium]|nr:phytanoyl-CoA dioxygenase family protein [Pseudomonadales bacterium]
MPIRSTRGLSIKIEKADIECFESDGYLVVKDVISKRRIQEIRDALEVIREKSKKSGNVLYDQKYPDATFLLGDLPSFAELEPFEFLVFNKDIVDIVRSLIGSEIVYFGESNAQSGVAVRGNHKDNRISDREDASGLDWQGDYPLVRVGIYLHDSDIYSGGVKIMPGSHKLPTSKFRGGGVNVDAKAGDLVIWKLTTTHSGNAKRLKLLKNLSLHPRIEDFVPAMFERLNPIERRSMFVVYGAAGEHLNRYIQYFEGRPDVRRTLRLAGTSPVVSEYAKLAGVKLVHANSDYGAEVNPTGFQFD